MPPLLLVGRDQSVHDNVTLFFAPVNVVDVCVNHTFSSPMVTQVALIRLLIFSTYANLAVSISLFNRALVDEKFAHGTGPHQIWNVQLDPYVQVVAMPSTTEAPPSMSPRPVLFLMRGD